MKIFPQVESRTRGNRLTIKGQTFRKEIRRNFFSQTAVYLQNSLSQKAVKAKSMDFFLRQEIDRFLINTGVEGYEEKTGVWS